MDAETPYTDTLAPNARELFAYLCSILPRLADDSPEVGASRDMRAMKAVVALQPNDDFEGRLAARIVAMDAHSADGLRLAALAVNDPAETRRCLRQAALMARQSDSTLRLLRRMQAERAKSLAAMHPAEMERAGYWFRDVRAPDSEPQPAEPPADSEDQPTPAQIDADAALYEAMYPDRARRILAAGGLPPDFDFGPPDQAIVAALLQRNGRARKLNGSSGPIGDLITRDIGS